MSYRAGRLISNAPCGGSLELVMDAKEMKQWVSSVARLTARQKAELIEALSVGGDDAEVCSMVESEFGVEFGVKSQI
jgi:hypothetical protein